MSPTLAGTRAAISARLGVTAHTTELLDADMRVLSEADRLPHLPDVAFYLYVQPTCSSPVLREGSIRPSTLPRASGRYSREPSDA
jgi:hypothetical protein